MLLMLSINNEHKFNKKNTIKSFKNNNKKKITITFITLINYIE